MNDIVQNQNILIVENLKKGDILKCVSIHPNSTAKITIGKRYEVKKIYYYFYVYHESTKTKLDGFSITDDNGNLKRFNIKTKSFNKADGSDLYNDEQKNLMLEYTRVIESLTISWMKQPEGKERDELFEKDRDNAIKEYLARIMQAKIR